MKDLYAIINVDEGCVETLCETKAEASDLIKIYKFSDAIYDKNIKYIIRKESNIL